MSEYRKGESGNEIPRRSPRVFQKEDGYWYFMTREKTEVGPFATDDAATQAVHDYAGFGEDVDRLYEGIVVEPVGDGLESLMGVEVAAAELVDPPAERITDADVPEAARQARMFKSRIFSRDAQWFFFTREGRDVGPFVSREEAEAGLLRYVDFASDVDRQIKAAYEEAQQQGSGDEAEDFLG